MGTDSSKEKLNASEKKIMVEELQEKLVNLLGEKVNYKKLLSCSTKYLESLDNQIRLIEKFMENGIDSKFDVQVENLKMLYDDKEGKKGEKYAKEYDDLGIEKKPYYISIAALSKKWAKSFQFDEDVSLISMYVYCRTFFKNYKMIELLRQYGKKYYKYEIKLEHKGETIIYRGDTMNSWATTLEEFFKAYWKEYFVEDFPGKGKLLWEYLSKGESYKYGKIKKPLPLYITEFLESVYTIGNFIPVPNGFNVARSCSTKDYWDLTLMLIYKWYHSSAKEDECHLKDFYLQRLVYKQENISQCKKWLNLFDDWNAFVERNYMQPFVKQLKSEKGEQYGEPLELWEGHFNGGTFPIKDRTDCKYGSNEWQFEQFFVNAKIRILQRGELIAKDLIKNGKENVNVKKRSD